MNKIILLILMLNSTIALSGTFIKNNTGGAKTWLGQQVAAGIYHEIEELDKAEWAGDDDVIIDVASGDAVVASKNDGSEDITDVSDAMAYLHGYTLTDDDGAVISRTKVSNAGWSYQMRSFDIETCVLGGASEMEIDGSQSGYFVSKFYDDSLVELVQGGGESDVDYQIRLDSSCKMTTANWTPTFDYEIIGGQMRQQNSPSTDMNLWIIGVPDYPPVAGGTKVFVNNLNLKFMSNSETTVADGRAPKELKYNNPVPGTNTMQYRFIGSSLGQKHTVEFSMEIFKQ